MNGVLTLSCEAVRNMDGDYEVQWKIQFPGQRWKNFFYCLYKSDVRCHVEIQTLPEGIKVLNNSNGIATLERSERNAVHDHARILCQVHDITDPSTAPRRHTYEVKFTARCKFSQRAGLWCDVLV